MADQIKTPDGKPLRWRIHTPNILEEALRNPGMEIMRIPFNILGKGLAAVAARAIELDDPELNALMCQLTLYSCADPTSPDHDPELTERTMDGLPPEPMIDDEDAKTECPKCREIQVRKVNHRDYECFRCRSMFTERPTFARCPHCRDGFAADHSHPTEFRLKACEFCQGTTRIEA